MIRIVEKRKDKEKRKEEKVSKKILKKKKIYEQNFIDFEKLNSLIRKLNFS